MVAPPEARHATLPITLQLFSPVVDAVVLATAQPATASSADYSMDVSLSDVQPLWQATDEAFRDGTTEPIPLVRSSLTAWNTFQNLGPIVAGERVLVLLAYTPGNTTTWGARYVLKASTMEPYPGVEGALPANDELQHIFVSSEDTAAERQSGLVEFVQEQVAKQRAINLGTAIGPTPRTDALGAALAPPPPPSELDGWRALPRELRPLAVDEIPPGHGLTFSEARVVLVREAGLENSYSGVGLVNTSGLVQLQAIQPEIAELPLTLRVVQGEPLSVGLYDLGATGVERWLGDVSSTLLSTSYAVRINVTSTSMTASPLTQLEYAAIETSFLQTTKSTLNDIELQ